MSFLNKLVKRKAKSIHEKMEEKQMKLKIDKDGKIETTEEHEVEQQTEEPTQETPRDYKNKEDAPAVKIPALDESAEQEAEYNPEEDPAVQREMQMRAQAIHQLQQKAMAQANMEQAMAQQAMAQQSMAQQSMAQQSMAQQAFNQNNMHEAVQNAAPNTVKLILNLIENQQIVLDIRAEELKSYMDYCIKCLKQNDPIIIDNNIIPLRSIINIGYN